MHSYNHPQTHVRAAQEGRTPAEARSINYLQEGVRNSHSQYTSQLTAASNFTMAAVCIFLTRQPQICLSLGLQTISYNEKLHSTFLISTNGSNYLNARLYRNQFIQWLHLD